MKSVRHPIRSVISWACFLATATVLGLILREAGYPQQITDPPRAALELRCPSFVLAGNQSMTLQADILGATEVLGEDKANRIAYSWEVSGGRALTVQGTSKITIDSADLPPQFVGSINVKLKLQGVPPDLEHERTCTLKVDTRCPAPHLYDQYGDIPLTDEQLRLDRLAKSLANSGAGAVAYIVAYAGRNACFLEAELRANRAKKYLVDQLRLEASRIVAVDGGFRECFAIDLFISPSDNCGPFPTPTVLRSKAKIIEPCSDKYKRSQ